MQPDCSIRHVPIPFDPRYLAAEDGRIFSTVTNQYLKLEIYGNKRYKLANIGGKICSVHRLILISFVGPCPVGMQCLHRNDVRGDCRLENLSWGTPKQNAADAVRNGRRRNVGKARKLSPAMVDEILAMYVASQKWTVPIKEIALMYGVTRATIGRLVAENRSKLGFRSGNLTMDAQGDIMRRMILGEPTKSIAMIHGVHYSAIHKVFNKYI